MTPAQITEFFILAHRSIFLLEFLIGLILVFMSYYIIKHIFTWVVGLFVNYL